MDLFESIKQNLKGDETNTPGNCVLINLEVRSTYSSKMPSVAANTNITVGSLIEMLNGFDKDLKVVCTDDVGHISRIESIINTDDEEYYRERFRNPINENDTTKEELEKELEDAKERQEPTPENKEINKNSQGQAKIDARNDELDAKRKLAELNKEE